jgi:glutaconyl-CoA decarboxylase
VTRKFKLTINSTTIDVEVEGPIEETLTITIGKTSFPVQVADGDSSSGKFTVTVGDLKHRIHLTPNPDSTDFILKVGKDSYSANLTAETPSRGFQPTTISSTPSTITPTTPTPIPAKREQAEPGTVTAPLPGRVLEVRVKEGTVIKRGDVLLVLEAMKMANEIRAPQDGTIAKVHVDAGTAVEKGQPMITLQ